MSKEKIVEQVLENDPAVKEIIIRTGEVLKTEYPEPLELSGTIDAPARFIENRKDVKGYDPLQSHALVNLAKGEIKLVTGETWPDSRQTVTGKVYMAKVYEDLGINDSSRGYEPVELSRKLKLMRRYFDSAAVHMDLVKDLRNLKAKVKQDLDREDDRRGNLSVDFTQTVEANLPENFVLNIPLIEGQESVKITVDVIVEADGVSNIRCYLESIDAAELIGHAREKLLNEVVERIEPHCTVIYV